MSPVAPKDIDGFTKITVVCDVAHNITVGSCALCERDSALQDARRYRTLRAMIGVLNVTIGRIAELEVHRFQNMTPGDMRIALDAELDRKFCLEFGNPQGKTPV